MTNDGKDDIVKHLKSLVKTRKIVCKQRKRKDKAGIDSDDFKIQDSTWQDSANEINQDEFENEGE